jgi:hypothetical protein
MNWVPYLEYLSLTLNATLIFQVNFQAGSPLVITNRVPLVDGKPNGNERNLNNNNIVQAYN